MQFTFHLHNTTSGKYDLRQKKFYFLECRQNFYKSKSFVSFHTVFTYDVQYCFFGGWKIVQKIIPMNIRGKLEPRNFLLRIC